jgi:hypothetical protein
VRCEEWNSDVEKKKKGNGGKRILAEISTKRYKDLILITFTLTVLKPCIKVNKSIFEIFYLYHKQTKKFNLLYICC